MRVLRYQLKFASLVHYALVEARDIRCQRESFRDHSKAGRVWLESIDLGARSGQFRGNAADVRAAIYEYIIRFDFDLKIDRLKLERWTFAEHLLNALNHRVPSDRSKAYLF